MAKTKVDPDLRIHAVNSFICGQGDCIVSFHEKPERSVAGALLEDATDWVLALERLERRNVPPGVLAAVQAASEAVANWVDWLDRADGTEPPTRRYDHRDEHPATHPAYKRAERMPMPRERTDR